MNGYFLRTSEFRQIYQPQLRTRFLNVGIVGVVALLSELAEECVSGDDPAFWQTASAGLDAFSTQLEEIADR